MLTRNLAPAVLLALAWITCAAAAHAQTTSGFPTISQRQYTGGSMKLTVSGSETMDTDIPLNHQASFSDGEVSWIQFGVSGSAEPNVLITYGQSQEIGVSVGKGKFVATGGITPGEKSPCAGTVTVTKTTLEGQYTCTGIVSHDPAKGLGKVSFTVRFTTTS